MAVGCACESRPPGVPLLTYTAACPGCGQAAEWESWPDLLGSRTTAICRCTGCLAPRCDCDSRRTLRSRLPRLGERLTS